MGIWRNIGKIVILLYQIVHEELKWYIRSYNKERDTTKKSNNIKEVNNKVFDELSRLKKNKIIERYREEERMVDLCEQPYYSDHSIVTRVENEPLNDPR